MPSNRFFNRTQDEEFDEQELEEEQEDAVYEEEDDEAYAEDEGEEIYDEDEDAEENADEEEGTDLDRLLNYLEDELNNADPVRFDSDRRKVSYRVFSGIINNIRRCLPEAVRYGEAIMDERSKIIREAKQTARNRIRAAEARADATVKDAEQQADETIATAEESAKKIVEEAQERARMMIDQSEIVRLAHEEADRMCDEARAEASDQKLQANRYAEELLEDVKTDLQETLNAINKTLDHLAGAAPVNASRRD